MNLNKLDNGLNLETPEQTPTLTCRKNKLNLQHQLGWNRIDWNPSKKEPS